MRKDPVPVLSGHTGGSFMARRSVAGVDDFASQTDKTLPGFKANGLHDIVHVVVGLAGLAMWRRLPGR
jgi:Domain of unknown function (DUF4383)